MNNHLSSQTSPYLLQHAHNPVDWYPWGKEALQKAQQENKPILLSIGYAACHWCHVMAKESFTDQETANLMNQWFINIKVDREERPDLDKIYQTAHQLLTGRGGGWPLTIFLTPDRQIPFYAGTYFPPEESFGRPAFKTILTEIAHFYYQRSDAIERISKAITGALSKINESSAQGVVLNQKPLEKAREELEASFDFIHGGFGRAPKFPLTTHLKFLLQSWYFSAKKDLDSLKMVEHTLNRMALGGLQDQLGGGFFRYCVDGNWEIPHFEKMLYDNAQLIALYADCFTIHNDPLYQSAVFSTIDWVLKIMRAPNAGFYASVNADSEGIEGKYYYWDRDEIIKILSPLEYSSIADYFGLNRPPNFEGHWHLLIHERDASIQAEWLDIAKKKLLSVRNQRQLPSIDKKILTGWNGLMISALIKASKTFSKVNLVDEAENTLNFIFKNLWVEERLLAVWADHQAHLPAYLDDYVFLLKALLDFLQIRWNEQFLNWAIQLANQILEYFYDQDNGGFFFTAADQETVVQRLKIFSDEATPSGNGIAVLMLLRLGYLLGEQRYLKAAEKTLQSGWEQMNLHAVGHDSLLSGLRLYCDPPITILLYGEPNLTQEWSAEFAKYYLPQHSCYSLSGNLTHLPESLQKPAPSSGVNAYICQGSECQLVVKSKEFTAILAEARTAS